MNDWNKLSFSKIISKIPGKLEKMEQAVLLKNKRNYIDIRMSFPNISLNLLHPVW